MPRNWDPSQNLNNGQVEWPQGPLTANGQDFPTAGWTARWLDAWVVQASTGASQATYLSNQSGPWPPGRWVADGIPPGWRSGTFQPGLALGIALLAFRKGTPNDEFEWWVDAINLY
jgi:hypothetical protein